MNNENPSTDIDVQKIIEKYCFTDLFDIDEIQRIQDAFSEATGVASIITETDGTPITKPSGFSCFCNEIVRKTEKGLKNCMKSDAIIGSPNPFGPRIQRCYSGGLFDAGASIMVGKVHIANWLIGQVLDEDFDINELLDYCDEIGADYDEYFNALKKVTRMPIAQFTKICDFLYLNAKMLSSLAIKNVMQQEEIERRLQTEAMLAQEKELFKVTLHSIGDAVITTDISGKITSINQVATKLTGWKRCEAIGMPLHNVFHIVNEKTLKRCNNPLKRVLKAKDTVMLPSQSALMAKDGSIVSISDSGAPICDEKGCIYGVVFVFRDITEEKNKNQRLQYLSYHDDLTGLYNRAFLKKAIMKFQLKKQIPISVIVSDVNGLKLTNDIFGHEEGDMLLKKVSDFLKKSCDEDAVIARWGGDEFIVILPDADMERANIVVEKIRKYCNEDTICKLKPSIALGVATKDSIDQSMKDKIKEAELKMYRNKLLEINSTRSAAVASLKSTMFEKSHEAEEHAQRMVKWSMKIGRKLGLTQSEMDDLNLSCVLHDIGKVAISDKILDKPGKLTAQEWEEMKKHSEIGFRIANSTDELIHVAEYILYHHERWDGQGYPHGKAGESIPIISRIISVTDAYDAMTNERLYRKAMTEDEAIDELISCSAKQFDPKIVDIFINLLKSS